MAGRDKDAPLASKDNTGKKTNTAKGPPARQNPTESKAKKPRKEESMYDAIKKARKEQSRNRLSRSNSKLLRGMSKMSSKISRKGSNLRKSMSRLFEEPTKAPKHCITRTIAEYVSRRLFLKFTLRDLLIYLVFAACALVPAVYIMPLPYFHLHEALERHFISQKFPIKGDVVSINFETIKTAVDFWSYMYAFGNFYYNEEIYDYYDPVREAKGPEKAIMFQNQPLGRGRIRQVRVRNHSCTVHPLFKRIFTSCFAKFSLSAEDTAPFGKGEGDGWVYEDDEHTGGVVYSGKIATYSGGGYIKVLPKTKEEFIELIQELERSYWIDRATRAVFLDFSIYNANINAFCACKLTFEFPHIGGVIATYSFGLVVTDYRTLIIACCIGVVFFITLFYLAEALREIVYFKFKYFKLFWSYMDLILICTTFSIIYLFAVEMGRPQRKVDYMRNREDEYGNLGKPALYVKRYKNCMAVQIFFVFTRAFKYLNFNKTMGQLNNTLRKCRKDIMGFSVMFCIVAFAFAEFGYLLFGDRDENFMNFQTSMFTLLRMILGDFDYDTIQSANWVMAPIFFISYVFFIFFVLLNMFLAIISDAYGDVKTEIGLAPSELQMTDYLIEKYGKLLTKLHIRKEATKDKFYMTVDDVVDIMSKCGYSEDEIETFLSRYIQAEEPKLQKLSDALAAQDRVQQTQLSSVASPKDMFIYQEKLEEVDQAIERCTQKMSALVYKLNYLRNVQKTPRT